MKRTESFTLCLCLLIVAGLSWGFLAKGQNSLEPSKLWIGPYLQDVYKKSITVVWETTARTNGYVRYGQHPDQLSNRSSATSNQTIHKVTLENLATDSEYYYQCFWDGGSTGVYRFKTAPPATKGEIKIGVYGDTRTYAKDHLKVANQIALSDPDIVLHAGDFIMYGADKLSWKPEFFDPAKPFISNIPFLGVPGNHEMNSVHYYNYFVHEGNRAWWSRDYGPVHIIGLDSNLPTHEGTEQYNWLIQNLEENKDAKWKIVILHHPMFCSRPFRETEAVRWHWHPIFQKYGVDLVFNSHNHYYARNFPIGKARVEPTGVLYINTAGGGAPLYPTIEREFTAYRRSLYHFVELNFDGDEMIGRAIDWNGELFDSFILNKNYFVGTGEFFAYDIVLIEKALNESFNFSAVQKKNERYEFNYSFRIPTELEVEVETVLKAIPNGWDITKAQTNGSVAPGQELEMSVAGNFKKDAALEAAELLLTIAAKDTFMWDRQYTPPGFKNTQITINLKDALNSSIMNSSRSTSHEALSFLHVFEGSDHTDEIINRFHRTVREGDPINKQSIELLNEIKRGVSSNDELFRFYPIHFLLNDFSVWDEWLSALEARPIKERSVLRYNLTALPELGITGGGSIRNWHILGVFDNTNDEGFDRVFEPEIEVDLEATYINSFGETIKWEEHTMKGNYGFDFTSMFERNLEVIVYAYCEIYSETDCEVPLLLGSDDGIVVWLNGKEIYRHNEERGVQRGGDILMANFKKGNNSMLVKVNQLGGGWGMAVDLIDKDRVLSLP